MSQTNTSFTRKMLEAHIILAEGGYSTRDGVAANTKIVRLGMDVEIQKPGGKEKNKAKVKIYNLPVADMEVLTTLAFQPLQVSKNAISVYAGDEEHGMALAFSGDIVSAVPNFNSVPDPSFDLDCITGYVASITPVPPLTAPGGQDVAALMAGLAKQMGLAFINRGVSAAVRNPAFVGGAMDQARQLADAARISLIVDDGEMVIAPPGELRSDDGGSTPVWNRETGCWVIPALTMRAWWSRAFMNPNSRSGAPCALKAWCRAPPASGRSRASVTNCKPTIPLPRPGKARSRPATRALKRRMPRNERPADT